MMGLHCVCGSVLRVSRVLHTCTTLFKTFLAHATQIQDAIDTAVTASMGQPKEAAIGQYTIHRFIPFNPVDKKTIAYVTGPDGKSFVTAKGAPQIIGDMLTDDAAKKVVDEYIVERASRGLRALGMGECV